MNDSGTLLNQPNNQISLETASASERIHWAHEEFGNGLILSTSFGIQSAVMLHLVTTQIPDIPIIFVDTGYLFPETYQFAEELKQRLNLNLKVYLPAQSAANQEAIYGKLWEQGIEGLTKYNQINKIEPMNRAVKELGAKAWLSGLRRKQSSTRENRKVVEQQNQIMKVYPIIDWNDKDVYNYLTKHNLPYHPLWDEGYVSMGDWHSTSKLSEGMTTEDTRFGGLKRECGLHESNASLDYQI